MKYENSILDINNLNFFYGNFHALKNINLSIPSEK